MNPNDTNIAEHLAKDFHELHPDLTLIEPKFAGGSGFVFRLKYPDDQEFALKVFRPDQIYKETLLNGFQEEGQRLVRWAHPRIVRAFEVSSAEFKSTGKHLPYYLMEWLPFSSLDVALSKGQRLTLSSLLAILHQVLDALTYLHQLKPPLCHLDVKEANLLVDFTDRQLPLVKLSDFGLAKEIRSDTTETEVRGSLLYWPETWQRKLQGMIPSNQNRAVIILPRNEIPVTVDLHMLSVTLTRLLPYLEPYRPSEYVHRALILLAERMNWDAHRLTTNEEKYSDAASALADLQKVDRSFSLPAPLTDMGMIRAPVNSLLGFGQAARAVIDLPWFQRLRGVRQLGTTHLIYPGAVHTRFEHALGACSQAVEYLRALLSNQNSPWVLVYFSEEEIKAVALAALLHDLGHYPFAHQLEDLANWPAHELLGYQILSGEIDEMEPDLMDTLGSAKTILEAIAEHWKVDKTLMLAMFAYCYRDKLENYGRPDNPRSWRVASEIINGPIDCDKLDYIRRDAEHCGVPYGLIQDPARFLSSLTVAFDFEKDRPYLAVTEKGRVDAELVAVSRYAMFSEVYWHHTVRSFTTMLRRAFYEASKWRKEPLTMQQLLRFSDDEIVNHILATAIKKNRKDVKDLLMRIKKREPYPRLFTLREQDDPKLYERLVEKRTRLMQGKEWKRDKRLCEEVFGIKNLQPHHLLWDIPKSGKDKLGPVNIAELDGTILATTPGPLWHSLSENFAQWVRRIRVFIHPDLAPPRPSKKQVGLFQKELADSFKV